MNIFTGEESSNLIETFLLNYTKEEFLHKFFNIVLYQIDLNLASSNTDTIEYFKNFTNDLILDIQKYNLKIEKKYYFSSLNLLKNILELKEGNSNIIVSYDNVTKYFPSSEILETVCKNKLNSITEFRQEFHFIYNDIQIYNQFKIARPHVKELTDFIYNNNNYSSSILNWLQDFHTIISKANITISDISSIGNDKSSLDYFLFSDDDSVNKPVDEIIDFLKSEYRSFNTGYNILDAEERIDSSSLTIIAGPTNHSKSIFMINILKKMIDSNLDFEENDAFLFISLEDDKNKIFRRMVSIFGNYDASIIKSLYTKSSEFLRTRPDGEEKIRTIFNELAKKSITSVTKNKIKLLTRYVGENMFGVADACRMIDSLHFQQIKVKALFIDYVDVMTSNNDKNGGEYYDQGDIIHGLRKVSRKYSIPIITITQNNRSSEDGNFELNNSHVADSFKKVRYSDNMIMIRQRPELDLFHDTVACDILIDKTLTFSNIPTEYLDYLMPFEVKITKAKDGAKNIKKFHIFNGKNLKIYESIDEIISDMPKCKESSDELVGKLNLLHINDFYNEESFSEDNLENLIL